MGGNQHHRGQRETRQMQYHARESLTKVLNKTVKNIRQDDIYKVDMVTLLSRQLQDGIRRPYQSSEEVVP